MQMAVQSGMSLNLNYIIVMCLIFPSVLGPVDASQLGVVLPHEHILVDFTRGVVEHPLEGTTAAEKEKEERIKNLELTMENQGLIRRFPYAMKIVFACCFFTY